MLMSNFKNDDVKMGFVEMFLFIFFGNMEMLLLNNFQNDMIEGAKYRIQFYHMLLQNSTT